MYDIDEHERAALGAALCRLHMELDEATRDLLLAYLHMLVQGNKKVNLTRITDIDEGIVLHLEDALSVYPEFSHSPGKFCDIGTGGGVPGIPLALVTGRSGLLVDSVKKKIRMVQSFIDELGLSEQVSTQWIRSEELAEHERETFETVVLRAVSSLPIVEELAAPLLAYGGRLIAMRGVESAEEIEKACKAAQILGLSLISKREFTIGDDSYRRSVFVFERVSEPSVTLPRRNGVAQKRPLVE